MEPAAEAELTQQYKQLYTEYRLAVTASYFADAASLSGQGLFEWQGPHNVRAGELSAPLAFLGAGTPDATSPPGAPPAFETEASPVKQGLSLSLEQPSPASVALLESLAGFHLPELRHERPLAEHPEPEQPAGQDPGLGLA